MPKCDTREPNDITTPLIRAGWTPVALSCGDFELADVSGEVVLIERKTVAQLLTDLQSGQLQRQSRMLIEASTFPILLIEGHWAQEGGYLYGEKREKFTWEQVWNALQTLQDLGCRLQITTSISHTVLRLFELQEYYGKEFHASIARHPSGNPMIGVLSQIYGVSGAKARSVLTDFTRLVDIANASEEDLSECAGIGGKLAKRIFEFWR